ncbi:MAG: hypothetical protein CTY32_08415 [Methylotenera sp.]|jgi:transcriptional regulator with XRE-family HTH domain|nr:MAG: hypothetical protein CTY32_08415 [Methylotenera sp.]
MTIQELIKGIQSFGLTQTQIAEKLNVSQNSVWQYLHGHVEDVRAKTYQRAEALYKSLSKKSA